MFTHRVPNGERMITIVPAQEVIFPAVPSISRLEVFSTNYRRTQLSAQGFLDGLLKAGGRGGVPVVVRPRADDFLNQWESRGHEMYEVC